MSQKPSPKSPRSKSPSCQEDEVPVHERTSSMRVIEEVQRQVQEELENSERLLNAASNMITGAIGSRKSSRPATVQEEIRSQAGSPQRRSASLSPTCYTGDPLQLPSPPRSPLAHASHGGSPSTSQRGTRAQTPEYSKSRSGSMYAVRSKAEEGGGMEPNIPEYEDAMDQKAMYRDMATSFSYKGFNPWDPRNPNEEQNPGYVNLNQRDMVSESTSMRGQQAIPNSREAFSLGSNVPNSNCAVAPSAVSGMQRGESAAASRVSYGPSRADMSAASGVVAPVPSAGSKYGYKPEDVSSRVSCRASCMRYADGGERLGNGGRADPGKYSPTYRSPMSGSRMGQPSWSQQFGKQAGLDHHSHHNGHGMANGRPQTSHEKYVRPAQTPSMGHDAHQHHHHDEGLDSFLKRDERAISALAHLSQLKKTPSYFMCGTSQGLDFLNACSTNPPAAAKVKIPEPPCLQQEELNELIKCEKQDVESVLHLASEESRNYKKPCPKQQKAQMGVRALVSAHSNQTCAGEKYGPLDHPDPDDISPEVAAKMMFSQEQGIKMVECPKDTIAHLFPDEPKTPFPEKIPRSTISIVDPNQKDREELMEKSASVPSEGVSDSAYTRTMKEKGDDMAVTKSYDVDFAIGQSKREYVLVAQKPQRFNRVQFRGGNLPQWFPGYFSAFPGEDGSLKSVSSPSGVFHKAWVHTNPRNIPTADVIVLE